MERAKKLVNISEVCREALARQINDPEVVEKYKKKKTLKSKFVGIPKKFVKKAENYIVSDPSTAERWANVANERFKVTMTPEDLISFISYQ